MYHKQYLLEVHDFIKEQVLNKVLKQERKCMFPIDVLPWFQPVTQPT